MESHGRIMDHGRMTLGCKKHASTINSTKMTSSTQTTNKLVSVMAFSKKRVNYLSFGLGQLLISAIFSFARRFLCPDDDGYPDVRKHKDFQREEELQNHQHQAVVILLQRLVPDFLEKSRNQY